MSTPQISTALSQRLITEHSPTMARFLRSFVSVLCDTEVKQTSGFLFNPTAGSCVLITPLPYIPLSVLNHSDRENDIT